jgi:hypothetical protein
MAPKIFADFNNADEKGRVRLNTNGSINDLKSIILRRGLPILLDDTDGLTCEAILEFSDEENMWVAVINWNDIQHYDVDL